MQERTRFLASAGLVVLGILLTFRPTGTATAAEGFAGYAFPSIVGVVPQNPATVDPRVVLADALAIVEAAGVPTDGAAVLAVVQQAQGKHFNYFDPAARDERGEQIWGKDGATIPADSMSVLRNRLQAAMVVDITNALRAELGEERFATYGFERLSGPTIAALEDLNRSGAAQNDPRWELAESFWAFGIADRVLAVDEAILAEGLRLTFPAVFLP